MKKIVIPAVMTLVGLGGGVGAGVMLRPTPEAPPVCDAATEDCGAEELPVAPPAPAPDPGVTYDYVRLSGQFVVPVLTTERVNALVVLSLTVEADPDATDEIEAREPKLRDALLQVLFDHAQSGGFDGSFTTGQPMRDLRAALSAAAVRIVGGGAKGVLVTDIVRQDL